MAENDARAGAQMNDQVRRMPLYRVLLHDDGLHLARYVAQVLQEVFYFSRRAAEEITSEAILQRHGALRHRDAGAGERSRRETDLGKAHRDDRAGSLSG